jgi:hypothetical protein
VCGFKNDLALAPLGEKTPQRAAPQITATKHRRAQLSRGKQKVNKVLYPLGKRVRVRGRTTGARVHEFKGVRVREHAGAEAMVTGQDDGGVTVSVNRQGVDREREARGVVGSGTCKRLLPSLAQWPASHSATAWWRGGDTTRHSRVNASLAPRPGAIGGRVRTSPEGEGDGEETLGAAKRR